MPKQTRSDRKFPHPWSWCRLVLTVWGTHRKRPARRRRYLILCSAAYRVLRSASIARIPLTKKCCIPHFPVVSGSHGAGERLLPERKDPGQARIRIDALSAA